MYIYIYIYIYIYVYIYFFWSLNDVGTYSRWRLKLWSTFYFCSIFLFKTLMRNRDFTFHFKVLMRIGVFIVFFFIYIFNFKTFTRTRIYIRFFCIRFYEIQSFTVFWCICIFFQRFDKDYAWYLNVYCFYLAKGKAFFKIGKMLSISPQL